MTFYRVLAKRDKYRYVMADYNTLAEANAAIADTGTTNEFKQRVYSIIGSDPDGYEISIREA